MAAIDKTRRALSHVRWIGGAPDAGKTSVAIHLAQKFHLQLYHLDKAEPTHVARISPELHPSYARFIAMSMEERWVIQSPETMTDQVVKIGTERFAMVLDDLLAMPEEPIIVAEGPWLFPELGGPILSDPRHAVWLVPTEAFKRASSDRRDKPSIRFATSDPERATQNWYNRDLLITEHIRHSVRELGLTLLEVDGYRSVDETADLLADYFRLRT